MINRIKTWWDNRSNPSAALKVFDKAIKQLDKVDARLCKQSAKCDKEHYNIQGQRDALVELHQERIKQLNVKIQQEQEASKEAARTAQQLSSTVIAKAAKVENEIERTRKIKQKLQNFIAE